MLFYQGDTVGNEMFMMHTTTTDQLEILQYDYPSNWTLNNYKSI